jgi:glycosyltransferase involved in cell wall biosynthesis
MKQSAALSIALLGTRGVPAHYGGFETCVEEVGRRLAARGHRVVVYCRRTDKGPALRSHLGMELVHLPAMHRRSLETLSHTAASVVHLARRPTDVAILFNAANAPLLPVIRARRIPVATHVDGLEWLRSKWGPSGRRYYRRAEALAVRWSDTVIADAPGIADYYLAEFGARSTQIAYGAPIIDPGHDRLAELGLQPRGYHLVVARFEPENHIHLIVEGYRRSTARLPLVVVGSAPYADRYTAYLHRLGDDRVTFLGGVWDTALLDQLYAGCFLYIHGHSVGGTNPSLLRAIGAGAPCLAFNVSFNRDVIGNAGTYFRSSADVRAAVERLEQDPDGQGVRGAASRERARTYRWDDVAEAYEELCRRLVTGGAPRRPSGRRRPGLGRPVVAAAELPTEVRSRD